MTLRYASGEEPIVGDEVRHKLCGNNGVVTLVGNGTCDNLRVKWNDAKETGTLDRNCILLRRADSRPMEEARPVLGKDRDGREVRKGSTLRDTHTGFLLLAAGYSPPSTPEPRHARP